MPGRTARRLRRRRRSVWGIALAVVSATPLHAQLVRGRVVAPADSIAIPGVLVQLVGPTGSVVAQGLSDQRGAYALRAPSGGSHRLRALRIGFRPTMGDAFAVAESGITERSLALTGAAVTLTATNVYAAERCDVGVDTMSLGFRAWEQARTALSASMAARQSSTYEVDLVVSKMTRAARRDSVVAYSEKVVHTSASRPFTAFSLSRLRDSGYVVRDERGVTVAAPDEEVLLSEEFAVSHCMRALPPRGDTIVLVFEPTSERKLSDVAGSLVLSRTTSELRSLRYEYVNVPREERDAHSGGELTFLRFPSGGWIVQRWRIRFPAFDRRETQTTARGYGAGLPRVDVSTRLILWQEDGGEALRVQENGKLVWSAPTTTLHGVVRDDSLERPMPGAEVTMLGAPHGASTDSAGRFVLRDVRIGDLQLEVSAPYAAALGMAPRHVHVLTRGESTWVALRVPHPLHAVVEACDAAGHPLARDAERSMVRGIVRDAYGSRAGASDVSITWTERASGPASEMRERRVRSSATGDYIACGLPVGVPLTLRAFVAGVVVADATARIPFGAAGMLVDLRPSTPK
ncbi:MAG: hypothetical protein JWL95_1537 [Gemmatimonadetes bacterium]|nr:hypothetical protein [Gemmatimonadota bacterium]